MKTLLTTILTFITLSVFGQIRPDLQPADYNPELTDEVYGLQNGSIVKYLFSSLDSLFATGSLNEITYLSDTSGISSPQNGDIAINATKDTLAFHGTYGWLVFVGGGGGGGSMDDWTLQADSGSAATISDGENVTISGGGIASTSISGNTVTVTATEVDGSTSNEIQTVDTLDYSSGTITIALENDGEAPYTVDISGVNTDDQNLTLDSTASSYTLSVEDGNSVSFSRASGSAQTLSVSDDTTTISSGNSIVHKANNFQRTYDALSRTFTPCLDCNDLWAFDESSAYMYRDPSSIIYYGGNYYFYATKYAKRTFSGDTGEAITCFESTAGPLGPYAIAGDVLAPSGIDGEFDSIAVFAPTVLTVNDTIWMFYDGSKKVGAPDYWSLGAAFSTNPTGTFTKYASNPIWQNAVDAGRATTFDTLKVAEISPVRIDEDTWRAWYKGTIQGTTEIGVITTTADAFPGGWTIESTSSVIEPSDIPTGANPENPQVWKENRTYYMALSNSASVGVDFFESPDGFNWTFADSLSNERLGLTGDQSVHAFDQYQTPSGIGGFIYHVQDSTGGDIVKFIRFLTSTIHPLPGALSSVSQWVTSGDDVYYTTGDVGIGTTSPAADLHVVSTTTGANLILDKNETDIGSTIAFRKSNDATSSVASGGELMRLVSQGYHTSNYYNAAAIFAEVDGTPGVSDMPGRLTFNVSEDGTTNLLERVRIANNGLFTLTGGTSGATSPASFSLSTGGSGTDIYLQSVEGTGNGVAASQRTQFFVMPGGTNSNAFINAVNQNSTTNHSTLRIGTGNSFAMLQTIVTGSPTNAVRKLAIDLDAGNTGTGEEFVIAKDGQTNNSSSTQLYNLNSGGQPDYAFYREEGSTTDTTDGSGEITVTHGAGFTPDHIMLTVSGDNDYTLRVSAITATTFTVVVKDSSGADVTTTSVTFYWVAKDIR